MQEIVRKFSEAVETRLDALDQTVRDLLQLVGTPFASICKFAFDVV